MRAVATNCTFDKSLLITKMPRGVNSSIDICVINL